MVPSLGTKKTGVPALGQTVSCSRGLSLCGGFQAEVEWPPFRDAVGVSQAEQGVDWMTSKALPTQIFCDMKVMQNG